MKIAVLALGSLAAAPAPRLDGPLLPIEFTWTTVPQRGLTLALCDEPWVLDVRTPWVLSTFSDFDLACLDLARCENVNRHREIGHLKLNTTSENEPRLAFNTLNGSQKRAEVLARLEQWGQDNHFDAIIWRDRAADMDLLQGKDREEAGKAVVEHCQEATLSEVEKFVRRVPMQVWTTVRAYMTLHPGTATSSLMPEIADTAITSTDDPRMQDWRECRTTIGRLDQSLEDLRKFGFTLITGLLTASSFLGLVPSAASTVPQEVAEVRPAAFIAIMVLITALFSVDLYYQVLLSGAVERALDLEVQTDPPIRVTKYLSVNALKSGVSYVTLFLYLTLLTTAEGLGILSTGGLNIGVWPTQSWFWIVGLALLLVGFFLIQRFWQHRPDWLLLAIKGLLEVGFTVSLGLFLLATPTATDLSSHASLPGAFVIPWIIWIGVALGVYIELYWLYVAYQTKLYRERPYRVWREGSEKVAAP